MARLRAIEDGLWWVPGEVRLPGGVVFPGRMTVVRLRGGGLWLHSAVPIDDALADELVALGPVRHLIAPCRFHDRFLAAAAERFPEATVWMPPELRRHAPSLPAAEILGGAAPPAWSADLDQVHVEGMPRLDEVVFLHRASRTAIVTDLVFNLTPKHWQTALVLTLVGARGRLAQSRAAWLMTRDAAAAAASARAILAWDFDRLIMAHGEIVERGAHARLAEALAPMVRRGAPSREMTP